MTHWGYFVHVFVNHHSLIAIQAVPVFPKIKSALVSFLLDGNQLPYSHLLQADCPQKSCFLGYEMLLILIMNEVALPRTDK
jgi:hypothetical protein